MLTKFGIPAVIALVVVALVFRVPQVRKIIVAM
jgi:hypothetical protein